MTRDELVAWGTAYGRQLPAGSIVALDGELGAGKTTLVQAICAGVGISQNVTSPTFSLVNEYFLGDRSVYHLDLYRITRSEDLTNLAWHEIINSGQTVLIEWADRAGTLLPGDAARICLEHVPGDGSRRRLTVR